jgi:hypothetical protein
MTKCGAELVMAAHDQADSRFNTKDPELGGKHAVGSDFPALGKFSIDDDARRFLATLLQGGSLESYARRLEWDMEATGRTTYCIVRLPHEAADRDHSLKLLSRVSELLPSLPLLVLTTESRARDHEEEYLRVLRRRFGDPKP